LRRCAEGAKIASKSSKFGLQIAKSEIGLLAWITGHRQVAARLTQELNHQLERAGVEILLGQASLIAANQIRDPI
jgi:pyruvate/2-oxoglutarate dehydrogenase complex dihydrolipoamide dehydrogenase (E3) component